MTPCLSDPDEWARSLYGTMDLSDARRTARSVAMLAQIARNPAGTVTRVFRDPAQQQAAYDWLEHRDTSARGLRRAEFRHALADCAGCPFAWVPVDFTDLNIIDRPKNKGTGRLGANRRPVRGFEVLTALVVREDGVCVGIAGQIWWARPEARAGDSHTRPLEDKETRFWNQLLAQGASRFAALAPGTTPWFLCDRGADFVEFLLEQVEHERLFTIRAKGDRKVIDPEHTHVRAQLAAAPLLGQYEVSVAPDTPRGEWRAAQVEIRACAVTLHTTLRLERREFAVSVWAVWVHESATTLDGSEPLDWLLYTTYPVEDFASACLVAHGYGRRARIEEFHKTWKSGGCDVEAQQLRSRETIEAWSVMLASVAVRLIAMRDLSRARPSAPATELFSAAEIEATVLLRQPHDHVAGSLPTVVRMVRWIAELGGYTGRSSGGPPGLIVLRRGWEHVQVAVRTLANARQGRPLSGSG